MREDVPVPDSDYGAPVCDDPDCCPQPEPTLSDAFDEIGRLFYALAAEAEESERAPVDQQEDGFMKGARVGVLTLIEIAERGNRDPDNYENDRLDAAKALVDFYLRSRGV